MRDNLNTLRELAKKLGTDKLQHGYIPYYAWHLPAAANVDKLLEIGIAKGASALMWKEYYPYSKLFYIDLFGDQVNHVSPQWCLDNGIHPYIGDQANVDFLKQITTKFDIIIDDGSHNSDQQLISFKHLFEENLNAGGLYVVEDLHCCVDPFYWNGDQRIESVDDTILGLAKKYLETDIFKSKFFTYDEELYFSDMISNMKLCCNEKLLFIFKK